MTSWVIVSKSSGKAVLETFSRKITNYVNTEKYSVIPIGEWLGSLNKTSSYNDINGVREKEAGR